MIDIKAIGIEYRIAGIFAGIAFLVSILGGVAAGVSLGVIIFRMIVSSIVFGGLGFGAVFVLKNYVPEVMGIFSSSETAAGDNPDAVEIPSDAQASAAEEAAFEGADGEKTEGQSGGFTEFSGDEYPRVNESTDMSGLNDELNSLEAGRSGGMNASKGKLGKHIISTEEKFQYEPKLMAQAVRTMMKKDE